jgi:hypothetical protein
LTEGESLYHPEANSKDHNITKPAEYDYMMNGEDI